MLEMGYPLDSGKRPRSRVGQTIGFCGLSGPGNAPESTDDKKRSSVPQGPCHSDCLNQVEFPLLQVRPAEPADLGAIATIQSASPEAALWPPGDYLQYDVRVAVRGRRVAGFLVTRRTAEGEAEVLNLAVAPEFRGQGVARAMMGAFLHGFRGDVFLEVRSSNSSAREFYKSLGFQEFTLRKDYYGTPPEAAIVMKFHSC